MPIKKDNNSIAYTPSPIEILKKICEKKENSSEDVEQFLKIIKENAETLSRSNELKHNKDDNKQIQDIKNTIITAVNFILKEKNDIENKKTISYLFHKKESRKIPQEISQKIKHNPLNKKN